jgi:hypothetical protein
VIDLFSGVAGLFGLFTGASLLSFFEVVELALEILFMWFDQKNKKINAEEKF